MKPKFKLSYRGEAEYWLNGREYCVRFFAQDDGCYNGDYFQTGILPFVGTVRNRRDFHDFPPADVIETFKTNYAGIVGARYSEDFSRVEYTETPDVRQWQSYTMARFHWDTVQKFA